MSVNVTDVVSNIDWELLRKQKRWLINQNGELAAGLIGLIDALQDAAVDSGLSTVDEVFGINHE